MLQLFPFLVLSLPKSTIWNGPRTVRRTHSKDEDVVVILFVAGYWNEIQLRRCTKWCNKLIMQLCKAIEIALVVK